jgi:hypothetical protein
VLSIKVKVVKHYQLLKGSNMHNKIVKTQTGGKVQVNVVKSFVFLKQVAFKKKMVAHLSHDYEPSRR